MKVEVEEGQELLKRVGSVVQDSGLQPNDKMVRLRQILEELLRFAVRDEPECTVATLFDQSVFVMTKLSLPEEIQGAVHRFRKAANNAAHGLTKEPGEQVYRAGVKTVCDLVTELSKAEVPETILKYLSLQSTVEEVRIAVSEPRIDLVRGIVIDVGEPQDGTNTKGTPMSFRVMHCVLEDTDDGKRSTIYLVEPWVKTALWPYVPFVVTQLHRRKTDGTLQTTGGSLLTVEPDLLIETTIISNCFPNRLSDPNPLKLVLSKFSESLPGEPMILGNVTNNVFDALLDDEDCDIESVMSQALRSQSLSLLNLPDGADQHIHQQARERSLILRQAVGQMRGREVLAEPTFLSAKYGITGRLDALALAAGDSGNGVVELKASRGPANPQRQNLGGQDLEIDGWGSHVAQAACYDLLVESATGAAPSSVELLYAGDKEYKHHGLVINAQIRSAVLLVRNQLVAIERNIAHNDLSCLEDLTVDRFGSKAGYDEEPLSTFHRHWETASPVEKAYVRTCSAFIAREYLTTHVGDSDDRDHHGGFATLWCHDLLEKLEEMRVLPYLELKEGPSSKGAVMFTISPKSPHSFTFRKGDIVVLYPHDGNDARPLEGQVFKGSITDIDHESKTLVVSLNNRSARMKPSAYWALEYDITDRGFKAWDQGLSTFLRAPADRRSVLLGLREPTKRAYHARASLPGPLTRHRNELLQQALCSEDYFLLQGPPGTGKTKYMLAELVRHLLDETDEILLVMAFTNRAVGEICNMLDDNKHDYVIFGPGAGSPEQRTKHGFDTFTEQHNLSDVRGFVAGHRIFVGTTSTCVNNSGIMRLLGRRGVAVTAIVDEASQLLEPQILGLLSQVDRFILIGDEKQLPAIVTQQVQSTVVTDPLLVDIGIKDLRESLFERLLRRCKDKGWDSAYGMLTEHARMHVDVAAFPSAEFYDGRLEPIDSLRQSSSEQIFDRRSDDALERMLASNRVLFIPSSDKTGAQGRTYPQEARRVAALVAGISRIYSKHKEPFDLAKTMGVITPFRAQIDEIIQLLPSELGKVTVDTVERYQGGEREIIIVSFAVHSTRQMSTIAALALNEKVDRKLNVMLTRARSHLILLGDPSVLESSTLSDGSPSHHARLLDSLRSRGSWVSDSDAAMLDE